MNFFGKQIRQLREESNLFQRQVAAHLDIDTPMLSKIERGERPAKREQIKLFAELFNTNPDELIMFWLADKLFQIIEDEPKGKKALHFLNDLMNRE